MRKWPAQVSTVVANVGRELSLLKMAIDMANADYLSFFLWNELEPRCQQRAAGSLELMSPLTAIDVATRMIQVVIQPSLKQLIWISGTHYL